MIRIFFIITSTIFPCSGVASQTFASALSQEFVNCMDKSTDRGGLITSERISCLNTELKAKEKLLHRSYQDKLVLATPDQKRLFSQSQKNWIIYRKAWCLVEKSSSAAPEYELNELFCLIELTSDQIKNTNNLALK